MDVFLSYRRDDSHYITDRVYDWLTRPRGRYHVFKDVDSIPLGRDFHQAIREAVGRCDVLLAVIGPGWLTASQAPGMRRIDDPDDFVRMEIEAALERDIPIVPLLVNHATMPGAEDLPPSLRPLAYRNGMPVRPDPDFRRDMERLIAALPKTRSPHPRRLPARRWLLGGAGVAALSLLCTILAITSGRVPSGGQRAVTKPPGDPAGPSPSEAEVAGPKPPNAPDRAERTARAGRMPFVERQVPTIPRVTSFPKITSVPRVKSVPSVTSVPTVVSSPTIAGEADDLPPRSIPQEADSGLVKTVPSNVRPSIAGEADDLPPRVKALVAALQDKEWQVRMRAAKNLAGHKSAAVVEALTRALGDGSGQVRQAAAQSLGQLGDPAAVPALMRRVADDVWHVRAPGPQILSYDDTPYEYDDIAEGEHQGSKPAALAALKKLAPEKVEQALLDATKSKNPEVRRWALDRLNELDEGKP